MDFCAQEILLCGWIYRHMPSCPHCFFKLKKKVCHFNLFMFGFQLSKQQLAVVVDIYCPTYWRGWGRGIAWTEPSSSRSYTASQDHVSKTKFFWLDYRSVELCGGIHNKLGFPQSLESCIIIRSCFMKPLLVHFQDCWQLEYISPKSLTWYTSCM